MSRILTVAGAKYTVSPYVHRRVAKMGWSISLPGYDQFFADSEYGSTQASLDAATAALQAVLALDVSILQHCVIEVTVIKQGKTFYAQAEVEAAAFTARATMREVAVDLALAEQLYNVDCSVPLNSVEAFKLLGQTAHSKVVRLWLESLRKAIFRTNVLRTNLSQAKIDPGTGNLPIQAPRRTQRPVNKQHRDLWWMNEH